MDNAQGNVNKSNFAAETTAQLFGVHVASRPIWTPAYIRPDGKLVQQKCEITVYGNVRDGGEPNKFDLTIWGDQADSWARFCSVGKEMHITRARMHTFMKRLFNTDLSPRMDAAGNHIQTLRVGFTVEPNGYRFGRESRNFINMCINEFKSSGGQRGRGEYWDVPGTADHERYQNDIQMYKGAIWDGQSDFFMFAEVRKPKLQGVRILTPQEVVQERQRRRQGGGAAGGAPNTGGQTTQTATNMPYVGQQQQNLPQQVAQTLPAGQPNQPGAPPMPAMGSAPAANNGWANRGPAVPATSGGYGV